jgi:N-acylneuraminate cytidylyltransferase/CMP-N,N'-diacetyllegionaminic acid synthase
LRAAEDIDASIALLQDKHGEAVVSVCRSPFPGSWLKSVDDAGRLGEWAPASPERSAFVLNGAIYLTARDVLLKSRGVYADPTWAYVMPRERSVDIDSPFDFELAEWLLTRSANQS